MDPPPPGPGMADRGRPWSPRRRRLLPSIRAEPWPRRVHETWFRPSVPIPHADYQIRWSPRASATGWRVAAARPRRCRGRPVGELQPSIGGKRSHRGAHNRRECSERQHAPRGWNSGEAQLQPAASTTSCGGVQASSGCQASLSKCRDPAALAHGEHAHQELSISVFSASLGSVPDNVKPRRKLD
ncbi:unnamed protein product [Urochloa humidicola]